MTGVLRLSAQMGNSVCQPYQMEQVVCPPTMRGKMFTTAAVNNINHSPSATTSKDSFHGTGISLVQHPICADDGIDRSIAKSRDHAGSKAVDHLPDYYTQVTPVDSRIKWSAIPPTSVTSVRSNNFEEYKLHEYQWLEHIRSTAENAVF